MTWSRCPFSFFCFLIPKNRYEKIPQILLKFNLGIEVPEDFIGRKHDYQSNPNFSGISLT